MWKCFTWIHNYNYPFFFGLIGHNKTDLFRQSGDKNNNKKVINTLILSFERRRYNFPFAYISTITQHGCFLRIIPDNGHKREEITLFHCIIISGHDIDNRTILIGRVRNYNPTGSPSVTHLLKKRLDNNKQPGKNYLRLFWLLQKVMYMKWGRKKRARFDFV